MTGIFIKELFFLVSLDRLVVELAVSTATKISFGLTTALALIFILIIIIGRVRAIPNPVTHGRVCNDYM